jgi:cell wall-associated NlpC family hydrolase
LAEGSRFSIIAKTDIRPGDLVVYDTCNADEPDLLTEPRGDGVLNDQECASRHVVMYLGRHAGQDWMIHSTSCGRGVTVDSFWGMDDEPGQVFRAVVRVRL